MYLIDTDYMLQPIYLLKRNHLCLKMIITTQNSLVVCHIRYIYGESVGESTPFIAYLQV